ncbi:hypothetical protein ANCCAN_17887 [Ancylostoma caninum]|uniref:GOLD domain-containing protein n=1 Tax=Ancylostoma caninum TaxID=29170 RepID=A0A368FZ15_ANCCA|nr:hypothetical protein ANCCAN_17887 [Ancylostoma caninum]
MDLDSRLTCLYEPLEKDMLLKLNLSPVRQSRFPLAMRLTSPSGEFSEWVEGDGEAYMKHNVTEDGDYEICVNAPRPVRVALNIFFHNPEKMEKELDRFLKAYELKGSVGEAVTSITERLYSIYYSIKFYNKISVRDEAMQQSNSDYIQGYVVIFCLSNIIIAISQVIVVRGMFKVDNSRIRI